jgi:Uma2 family endonuclease
MSFAPEQPQPILGRSLTLEEWAAMDEDEPGELVDGRLEEEEVPGVDHEIVVSWLVYVFRSWLGKAGWVIPSDARFAVTEERGRKPDLAIYLTRVKLAARAIVTVPPDIAIEVVSPTPRDERRDRIDKMNDYAGFGIRFYWIVDPMLRSLEIFELVEGRYSRAAAATEGALREIPGCEGLTIDLDDLWSELAQLESE